MRNVTPLKTRPQRFKEGQAEALKALLLPFLDDPAYKQARDPIERVLVEIARQTRPDAPAEPFLMIRASQNLAVVTWLMENSTRPKQAALVWATLFDHLYQHTGEVKLTRDELAEATGIDASHVSEIMGELVRFDAVFTKRERLPGVRGPGKVVYFMNKHVAEYGSRSTEEELSRIPKPGSRILHLVKKVGETADNVDAKRDAVLTKAASALVSDPRQTDIKDVPA